MSSLEIVIIGIAALFILFSVAIGVYFFLSNQQNDSSLHERQSFKTDEDEEEELFVPVEVKTNVLSLESKLKFANWSIPQAFYRSCEVLISIVSCIIFSMKFNIVITIASLSLGPLVMKTMIDFSIGKRFKNFDTDYPSFLLSMVGLLKTGMNATSALETAAKGLDSRSLVKEEVMLMLERLRFGVSEEKSIGAFAEDIDHPEIELFVQALILSRRVGGNLSETLERLAGQVRKRQQFRNDARSAVGMQKGSIWFIICILAAIEIYLYFMYPAAVVGSIQHPVGWQVWQVGIMMMLFGIWWLSQIVKIRV